MNYVKCYSYYMGVTLCHLKYSTSTLIRVHILFILLLDDDYDSFHLLFTHL